MTNTAQRLAFMHARRVCAWNPSKGYKKAMLGLAARLDARFPDDAETIRGHMSRCRVPDGWMILRGEERPVDIHLLEIEDTHHLKDEKLRDYVWFWFGLDSGEAATLTVWRTDRSGMGAAPVPMLEHYYRLFFPQTWRELAEGR